MNEAPPSAPANPSAPTPTPQVPAAGVQLRPVWLLTAGAMVLLAVLASVALVTATGAQQRLKALEAELVRRQQDSGSQSTEARTLARQAEQGVREVAAKLALLEARLAETTLQRSQLEELIQNLSRSRDESVLIEVEAALRVAMQQAAITGRAEPLVVTLRQADERLARYSQPRLERVRRAVTQDLERTRTAGVTDIALLTLRLDEVMQLVDKLPLLSEPRQARAPAARPAAAGAQALAATGAAVAAPAVSAVSATQPMPAPGASSQAAGAEPPKAGWAGLQDKLSLEPLRYFGRQLWQEVQSLVRVSRIDQPEAMLVAPEQAWFLRQNLRLRLLNARLALLSRQYDTAQSDLLDAQAVLERYFDGSAAPVASASALVREVRAQARVVDVPRPEATLAAIAAVTATAAR